MLKNTKGTVLVVAVVAMMIMLIIGLICLKIYTIQAILDTYDQSKMRALYSAEGAIEMMRGYIDAKIVQNLNIDGDTMNGGRGFLQSVTPVQAGTSGSNILTVNWDPFRHGSTVSYRVPLHKDAFDGTIHPSVFVGVYLRRITKNNTSSEDSKAMQDKYNIVFTDDQYCKAAGPCVDSAYKIVAVASTTHKTMLSSQVVVSTVTYFFTTHKVATTLPTGVVYVTFDKKFEAWRID